MHFFKAIVGTVALASSAVAQLTLGITKAPSTVAAGQTYTIEYLATDSAPVTLTLRKGLATDLKVVGDLASGLTTGSFQWTVDTNLVSGDDYAIEITQSGQKPNYFGPFPLTGGAAATSSASSSSSSSAASVNVASVSASSSVTSSASLSSAASSLSSVISAANSTLASLTASNATITSSLPIVTPGSNSSMTLRTSTAHATSTDSSASASSTGTAPSSGAANMASPMALLFGAVAAMIFFN